MFSPQSISGLPLLGAFFLVLFSGCAEWRNSRKEISGSVSYRGEPISDGFITFIPLGDTPGSSTGAEVKNGEYSISASQGVARGGSYRVEIEALRSTGRSRAAPQGLVPLPAGTKEVSYREMENYLPEKYHVESVLTATVGEGAEAEIVDFALQ
ncbi:MAG TPA: hypothetical protein PKC18_05740 [Lacipirellulaceae bacterium]|nr:hypothetical protein [Lacipirellulaceae bacterium]HMP04870.1 hypothetical protein [Lacipirellulaceae bacterium]